MKKVLFHIFVVMLFTACSGTNINEKQIDTVEIDITQNEDNPILFDELFQIESMIPLESNPKCLITKIKRVIFYNDCYYILDKKKNKCVLVFDNSGRFLCKIGNVGHGHGEYVSVEDFTIDKEGERVIILSENSTIYEYDMSGNFKEMKELDKSLLWSIASNPQGFLLSSNHLTYTSGENAFLFYFFDKEFHLEKKFFPVLPMQMYAPSSILNNICISQDRFVYNDMYTHKSYIFDESTNIEVSYDFKLKNPMPIEMFCDTEIFIAEQFEHDYLLDVVVLHDKIISFYRQDNESYVVEFDNKGKILQNSKYLGILPIFLGSDGDCIFSALSAYELLQIKDSGMLTDSSISIDPDDNLYIIKLKSNI